MNGVDVFISYKREERAVAESLAAVIASRGYSVWWDVDLLPGERFAREIAAVIDSCRCAIVMWSPASVESDWVLDEAHRAKARGVLAPVVIDQVDPPLGFGRIHAHDLTSWDGTSEASELAPLLRAVEGLAGPGGRAAEASESAEPGDGAIVREATDWRSAEQDGSTEGYQTYLERYGEHGLFSALARERLSVGTPVVETPTLQSSEAVAVGPTPPIAEAAVGPARPPRFSETWDLVHTFRAAPGEVQTVLWSFDGKRLAAEGTDSPNVTVWDPIEGRAVSAYPGPSEDSRPIYLAFSRSSRRVAAVYGYGGCGTFVFDAETGAEELVLLGELRSEAIACAFSLDDRRIATANDGLLSVWDAATGALIGKAEGSTRVGAIRFVSEPHDAVVVDDREGYERWQWTKTGQDSGYTLQSIPVYGDLVPWEANPARTLRWTDHNMTLELWDEERSDRLSQMDFGLHEKQTLQLSPDGSRFLAVRSARATIWSALDGRELGELPFDGSWIRRAHFSPDGSMVATGDASGCVCIWRPA